MRSLRGCAAALLELITPRRGQIEYYLSEQNLANDTFLRSKMDAGQPFPLPSSLDSRDSKPSAHRAYQVRRPRRPQLVIPRRRWAPSRRLCPRTMHSQLRFTSRCVPRADAAWEEAVAEALLSSLSVRVPRPRLPSCPVALPPASRGTAHSSRGSRGP